ncbi:hypothetical protein GCM10027051_24960 [Niabella terrae]
MAAQVQKSIIKKTASAVSKGKAGVTTEKSSEPQAERTILLNLSNDITRVRGKDDLVKVFSSRLKEYFYFTHVVISLIDNEKGTYYPFLIDRESMPIRHRNELPSLLQMQFVIDDPFLGQLKEEKTTAAFLLESIIDEAGIPAFLKVNYECGVKKAMIVRLKNKMETIGHVLMYSDRTDSFPKAFENVLEGIAPHLSNAVANIIINLEMEEREHEKSLLLALSEEIAALRKREDLLHIVNTRIKKLFGVREFGVAQINSEENSYRSFIMDVTEDLKQVKGFESITTADYDISDPLFDRILQSDDPLLLDIDALLQEPGMPDFVGFWKMAGLKYILAMKLHVGEKNVGCAFLHLDAASKDRIKPHLLKAVCAHLSVAVSNILSNEQISQKSLEQHFLLEFSKEIARVRTKDELQTAIFKVLEKTLHIQLGMIQVIEEDEFNLRPFMYDARIYKQAHAQDFFEKMLATRVTIDEHYTAQVLSSGEGIIYNVAAEAATGNPYARLWETIGYQNMYALPLRTGSKNIGTIWLHANQLSELIVNSICAQISIAISNIQANEKLLAYKKQLEVENDYLKEQIKTIYNFTDIIGSGPAMQQVYQLISLVAESNSTVLLLGETGTGKELIARAIHNASPRKDKLMVKVNCAALPANLIESELFGHERGAFTGALERRIGKFEMANNSTLFLDEIGEMTPEMQVKLLRVLQERELERIGGGATIQVDVRIIAATNRNLEAEVKAGRFRSDLYYRLNVFPITLPPLRHRKEDIEALAYFFLERYCKNAGKNIQTISSKCIHTLKSYEWPGNVRELEHLIERSILLTPGPVLHEITMPQPAPGADASATNGSTKTLDEIEKAHIIEVLRNCQGKISGSGGASGILGIPATTLHSKMKKLQILKSDYHQ